MPLKVQKAMNSTLDKLIKVICYFDDILFHHKAQQHNKSVGTQGFKINIENTFADTLMFVKILSKFYRKMSQEKLIKNATLITKLKILLRKTTKGKIMGTNCIGIAIFEVSMIQI